MLDRGPWFALGLVIAAAIVARAWLLFRTPLVPGMNGGYYLVQARSLLQSGALGIPDFPLTFALQAALAGLVHLVSGRDLESSILLAVKLADAALPPLAAIPVFLLGRTWCRRRGRSAWVAVAAALAVALGVPALSMVGDFQKNSLGLVWLAGLAWAFGAWMERRTVRRALGVILLLGLAGVTHIGVFGTALLLAALISAAGLALPRPEGFRARFRTAWPFVAGALGVVALAAGLVLWKFDPSRIHRLAGAITHPTEFLQSGGPPGPGGGGRPPGGGFMGGPPGGGRATRPFSFAALFRGGDALRGPGGFPFRGGGPGGPPGGPGGPGFLPFAPPAWLPFALTGAVVAFALYVAGRKRVRIPASDAAVAIGCAGTALALTGPWVQGDVLPRFGLLAVIPGTLAGLFVLAHLPGRWLRGALALALSVLTVLATLPLLRYGGRPIISEAAYGELRELAATIEKPQRTLVVARHGLEWWTAWTLHTHISQARALTAADWKAYETVLFLEGGGGGPGGFGGPGFGGPGFAGPGFAGPGGRRGGDFRGSDRGRDDAQPDRGGPDFRPDNRGPDGAGPDFGPGGDDFGGPPPPEGQPFDDAMAGGPPPGDFIGGFPDGPPQGADRDFRDDPPRGGDRAFRGPPGMMEASIPSDATILHEGQNFTLAKVTSPPAYLEQGVGGRGSSDQ